MTHDEYQQILQNSELFQGLPKDTQTIMIEAKEDEWEHFIQVIHESDQFLDGAKREMIESNERVMKSFQGEVKSLRKDKLKSDEARSAKTDNLQGKSLLEKLDNL